MYSAHKHWDVLPWQQCYVEKKRAHNHPPSHHYLYPPNSYTIASGVITYQKKKSSISSKEVHITGAMCNIDFTVSKQVFLEVIFINFVLFAGE